MTGVQQSIDCAYSLTFAFSHLLLSVVAAVIYEQIKLEKLRKRFVSLPKRPQQRWMGTVYGSSTMPIVYECTSERSQRTHIRVGVVFDPVALEEEPKCANLAPELPEGEQELAGMPAPGRHVNRACARGGQL